MTKTLLRAGALSCALLASTALTNPACAQTAPPAHRNLDANGVDLARGDFVMAFNEGTIGSGEGALSLVRNAVPSTGNAGLLWDGIRLWQGTSQISVYFGPQQETFSSGFGASNQGNGSTLNSSFVHTAADGTTIAFVLKDPNCTPGALSCEFVPDTVTSPDGRTVSLAWEPWMMCDELEPDQCTVDSVRLTSVRNSYGYEVDFNYASGSGGGGSGAPSSWSQRTSADFYNTAISYSPQGSVSYSYPSSGVIQVTDLGGNAWRFAGGANGITGIRRPGAGSDTTSVSYSSGKVSAVTREGVTTSYSRSVSGSTATMTVTDAGSNVTTVVSDLTIDRPTSVTDPLSRVTSYAYDGNGRLTRVTAPEGNYVNYTYDGRGNVTETRAVAKSGSGLNDMVTTASYDSTCSNPVTCNQPNTTTDASGNVTNYTYDATHGGVTAMTSPAPGGSGTRPETRYSYTLTNGEYRLTGTSSCASGDAASGCIGTANERRTVIAYDANGNTTSVEQRDGSGSLSATSAMTYDAMGNLLTVDGPLSGSADTTRYRYNAARQVVGVVGPDPDGGSSLHHRAVRATYTNGLPTKVEQGNVNSQSDGDWASFSSAQEVAVEYDANARPVVQRLASGGTTYQLTQTSYDGLGRAQCSAQRMNPSEFATASLPSDACTLDTQGSYGPDRITRRTFDNAGQLTKVETGYGVSGVAADEMQMTYRNNGQVETVTDANGNKTTYVYDGLDRLSRTRMPDPSTAGASSSTDYSELSYATATVGGSTVSTPLVSSLRLRDGNSIAYTYDALNRPTLKNLPGSELDVAYAYDLLGRATSVSTSAQTLTFAFDALGRNISQGDTHGVTSYVYDLANRRTRMTYPDDGLVVGYTYDVANDLTEIRENPSGSNTLLATYAWDDRGRRTSLTRGNGAVTSYSYDNVSRLTQLVQNLNGTVSDVTFDYTLNPAGEIASTILSNDSYAYTGHANANVTGTANGLNQLTAVGGVSNSHDSRGNVSAIGSSSYGYSSENLLNSAPSSTTLSYDPANRLYRTAGGSTTLFGYDGGQLIGEYNSSNTTLLRRYVFGPGSDEPLVWYEGSGTSTRRYFHADERGSVVAVSDASGDVVTAVNRYDEYGNVQGTLTGRFGYTGQAWVPEIGMAYYRARIYNPAMGRFMQTDPIGMDGGMNIYAYVRNNPGNFTDPSGEIRICVSYPNGPHGPASRCIEVDANKDGRTSDNDLTQDQADAIRSNFFDFIARYGGPSSHPLDISQFSKTSYGGTALERSFATAISGFVGYAISIDRTSIGDKLRSYWNQISYLEFSDRHHYDGAPASTEYLGAGEYVIFFWDNRSTWLSTPSDFARVFFHEPLHISPYLRGDGPFHSLLDEWARTQLGVYGLGKCHSAPGFPRC
ncbi:RHS repeat domain-containing protein [Allosphingosinicella sp.]|uniref:RHS repeat domain-containing protein n=1 Tax=Allosphingosinicella sp. TaxID=2823234 RepID=UPI0037844A67